MYVVACLLEIYIGQNTTAYHSKKFTKKLLVFKLSFIFQETWSIVAVMDIVDISAD